MRQKNNRVATCHLLLKKPSRWSSCSPFCLCWLWTLVNQGSSIFPIVESGIPARFLRASWQKSGVKSQVSLDPRTWIASKTNFKCHLLLYSSLWPCLRKNSIMTETRSYEEMIDHHSYAYNLSSCEI